MTFLIRKKNKYDVILKQKKWEGTTEGSTIIENIVYMVIIIYNGMSRVGSKRIPKWGAP